MDVPLFTESCLILAGSYVKIEDIFCEVTAFITAFISFSKFQVCCIFPDYAKLNAPADLLPFIGYLRFWCGVFVKMDGGSAFAGVCSEEFIEILNIAGELLLKTLCLRRGPSPF